MTRILVVEDDRQLQRTLQRVLRASEVAIDFAGNGVEGLDRLKQATYDLIISDVEMPRMNGIDFFKKVQELHQPMLPKFVFFTGVPAESVWDRIEYLGVPVVGKHEISALRSLVEKLANPV